MSMKHNGVVVTPFNYRQLYRDYPQDIQEEVYMALGGGVDLEPYVDRANDMGLDGASWLGQVRRALCEGVDRKWFRVGSDRVLVRVRYAKSRGIGLKGLEKFIDRGFSERKWLTVLGWYLEDTKGIVQILPVLHKISDACLDSVSGGLKAGLPVWELWGEGSQGVTPKRVSIGVSLMSKGRWEKTYCGKEWSTDVLCLLAGVSSSVYDELLNDGLSSANSLGMVVRVVTCIEEGLPGDYVKRLLSVRKGDHGYSEVYPVWLAKHIEIACMRNYGNIDSYFKEGQSLEDVEMLDRLNEYNRESSGGVSGSLYPKTR